MASLECILCFIRIQKKGDINLVQGKRDFDVLAEIKSLHFVVRPISTHICRNCLNFLKHRANQRKKFDEINSKLLIRYREKAQKKSFTVKLKSSAKRLEYGDETCSVSAAERSCSSQCEGSDNQNPSSSIYFLPLSPVCNAEVCTSSYPVQKPIATSTPHRVSTHNYHYYTASATRIASENISCCSNSTHCNCTSSPH